MQTIIGAGGAIGSDLARELTKYTKDIRLVSRNPKAVNESDKLMPADLTDLTQVDKAIEGSEIVYVVIGFPYKTSFWQKHWPAFISSVIKACKKHEAKLVFFDNIYMYDPDYLKGMTEETPYRPVSKKGKVRKEVAEKILSEIDKGELTALIARAPDFLGTHNSVITELTLKNLKKGKRAMWPGRLDKIHNYTFTPDAARAVAILGNTTDAYNQTWHIPADPTPYTGEDWLKQSANLLGVKPKVRVMKSGMMGFLGIFIPVLKEMKEMNYQYERDYLFDSSKFNSRFNFKPTPALEALQKVLNQL